VNRIPAVCGLTAAAFAAAVAMVSMPAIAEPSAMCDGTPVASPSLQNDRARKATSRKKSAKAQSPVPAGGKAGSPVGSTKANPQTD
jgi:hypothetical protein